MSNRDASENPNDPSGKGQSRPPRSGVINADSARRRRILKGSAAAALIMTVSSKSALGGPCTVSGALSGNLSIDHGNDYCGGRGTHYWRDHMRDSKTRFIDVFGGLWRGYYGTWHPKVTMKKVLLMDANHDRFNFGSHSVAAYMNALTSSQYPMKTYEVVRIVQAVLSPAGVYIDPVTGKTLDVIQVRDFFYGTFDAG